MSAQMEAADNRHLYATNPWITARDFQRQDVFAAYFA